MPDDHAAAQQAVAVIHRRAGLTVHFPDGGGGPVKIVRGAGIFCGKQGRTVFQVRQIDVHAAVNFPQRFHGVVTAGVIHDRQAVRDVLPDIGQQMRIVRRVYQVDIVCALRRQLVQYGAQALERNRFPIARMAEVIILAIDAAQRTSGEKNRAGAAGSADTRFLPMMQRGARKPRQRRRTAIPLADVLSPSGSALPGAL